MAIRTPPPPAKGMDPRSYYIELVNQGFSNDQAYQAVQQTYGPPRSQQQQAKDKAKGEQTNAIAGGLGTVGGAVAGKYVMDNAGKWWDIANGKQVPAEVATKGMNTSGSIGVTRQVPPPTTTVDGSGGTVDLNGAPITEVGSTTMPDGSPGTLMSDGGKVGQNGKIVNPDGTPGGSITGQALAGLQIAGGAAQAYSGYKQYQAGEKLGGAANVAGGAYTTAAGAQSLAQGGTAGSLSGAVPYVGAAVAAAQVGQQMLNEKGSSADRAAKAQAEAQKAAMLWIPGYGWVAYAALAGLDAITGGKATKALMDYNKLNAKITDKFDLGLGKNLRARLFHQSTKGVQEMHTGQLLQQSEDPTWQNYVIGMRAQVKEGPKDKEKPYGGKYRTWDEAKKAGLDANDLTGVYGNIDAFKPAYADKAGVPNWAKLNFDQQKAVTQRLIDEDMYSSKKGEVVIKDKEKARRIYEEMSKTNFNAPAGQANQTAIATPKKGEVARTSAGMYMNDQGVVKPAKDVRSALEKFYTQPKEKKDGKKVSAF